MPVIYEVFGRRGLLSILLFWASISVSFNTWADDLLGVYQLAEENDSTYLAAIHQHAATIEALPQARADLLPNLAFEAERIQTRQDIISSDNIYYDNGTTRYPTNNLTLSLTQPLFRYGDWIAYEQSKLEVQQADVELAAARQQLILDVAETYFAALTAADDLEYIQVEKAAVGKELEEARTRTRTGLSRITDLYDAEARYAVSESREVETQNILSDSFLALQELTNQYPGDLIPVSEAMPLVSPDPSNPEQWVEAALQDNLALQARRLSFEAAQQEVKRQKAGHMPNLDLVASLNRRDTDGSLLGGGSDIETGDIMLRFTLPIYQGGRVQSKIHEASSTRSKTQREMEGERRRVERETRSAYLGVLSGIKKVEALKQSIISQESTLKVKSAGVNAGVNTLLEVLDAQRDLYFVRRDHSKARYDYLLSTLKLKQASGNLSVADLQEINRLIQ